jgi:hypothetical protein
MAKDKTVWVKAHTRKRPIPKKEPVQNKGLAKLLKLK